MLAYARPIDPKLASTPPLAVRRGLASVRAQDVAPELSLKDGWLIEPLEAHSEPLWIWGAGHVGRALVQILAPLNEVEISCVDTAQDRFPKHVPAGVSVLNAAEQLLALRHVPAQADHLIVTYSHALEFELCHQLLAGQFNWAG